jgi:hypothetical protein
MLTYRNHEAEKKPAGSPVTGRGATKHTKGWGGGGTAEARRSGRDAELLGRWSAEQLAALGEGIKEGGL